MARVTGEDGQQTSQGWSHHAKALRDRTNHTVATAAEALKRSGDKEAVPHLIQAYGDYVGDRPKSDPGAIAKWHIVDALAALIVETAVDPHRDVFQEGTRFQSGADVFLHAIQVEQIERSGMGLEDVAVGLRGRAALALAETGADGALVPLGLLLFDMRPAPSVALPPDEEPFATLLARRSAARALGHLGDPAGAALLAIKLTYPEDELPELLVESMDAVAALDPDVALTTLPPFLTAGDDNDAASGLYLTAGAATALASLAEPYHGRVLEYLEPLCRRSLSPDVQEAAALAIASMRSDEARDCLEHLAKDQDEAVRKIAQEARALLLPGK